MTPAPTSPSSVRARLQQSTQALHRRVERHFALNNRPWTALIYCTLLKKLWGIYVPLERRLAQINWQDSGISIRERRKTSWLKSDLTYFGMTATSIAELDQCQDLPDLDTVAAGLGALYVLEGATLGGQLILKTLQPQLGISSEAGGRFFSSYGKSIGLKWRDYLAALERLGAAPHVADAIEHSAILTFAAFDRWFAESETTEFQFVGHSHV
jgi:heme oxygenase